MSALRHVDPDMRGVVWTTTSKEPRVDRPPSETDIDVELAVVGGGYCGLVVALHAAAAGIDTVLLDAGIVGAGASGRNGGFVVPHFPGAITPEDVRAAIGERKGAALAELVSNGPDAVMARIERYQIRCDARQNGWLQPAHSPAALRKVRRVYEGWRALGAPVEWLDREAIAARTGATGYLGGWRRASGIHLNPFALCQGLARAAEGQGVRIHERSPVTTCTRDADGSLLSVGARRVRARRVVFATNGYTAPVVGHEHRSVIPLHLFHVATRPLDPARRAGINTDDACFTDLRRSGGFTHYDVEGRLLSGGAVMALSSRRAYGERHARRRLRELFPQLGTIRLETYWEGWCALTENYLPRVQVLAPEVYSIGGFSTRGVALAQNIGELFAEFLAGRRELGEVPLPVLDGVHRVRWQPLKAAAARVVFPYYQTLDRLGLS